MKLSAVLIARDEAKNLRECFEGLKFCDEIVMVDSGSHDGTADLALSLGAKVFLNPFKDFASQKNFAIGKARGEWVLLVDADERVSPELASEIRRALEAPRADGYFLRRRNRIFGRWMCHGDSAGDKQLRLALRQKAVFAGRVHERIYLDKTTVLREPLLHYSTPDVKDYMKKLNLYTSLEAQGLAENGAGQVEKMKSRPFVFFCYVHFVRQGFLDGLEGFLFSVLSAYYEFVRRAKQWELMETCHPRDLQSGIKLDSRSKIAGMT